MMSSKEKESSLGEESEDERKTVLVAVDGSTHSDNALRWYLKHLHRDSYEVHLLHVADPDLQPILAKQGMAIPREQWELMVDEFRVKINEMKKKYLTLMEKANVSKVRFVHKNGSPGPAIVQAAAAAEQEQAEGRRGGRCRLIVVGCRGLGSVGRTILGSVSDHVLHHASVPVAVCRGL